MTTNAEERPLLHLFSVHGVLPLENARKAAEQMCSLVKLHTQAVAHLLTRQARFTSKPLENTDFRKFSFHGNVPEAEVRATRESLTALLGNLRVFGLSIEDVPDPTAYKDLLPIESSPNGLPCMTNQIVCEEPPYVR